MIVLIHKYLDWRRVILAVAAFVFVWNLSLNHNALASTDKFLSNEPQDAAYVLKRTVQVTPRRAAIYDGGRTRRRLSQSITHGVGLRR